MEFQTYSFTNLPLKMIRRIINKFKKLKWSNILLLMLIVVFQPNPSNRQKSTVGISVQIVGVFHTTMAANAIARFHFLQPYPVFPKPSVLLSKFPHSSSPPFSINVHNINNPCRIHFRKFSSVTSPLCSTSGSIPEVIFYFLIFLH